MPHGHVGRDTGGGGGGHANDVNGMGNITDSMDPAMIVTQGNIRIGQPRSPCGIDMQFCTDKGETQARERETRRERWGQ